MTNPLLDQELMIPTEVDKLIAKHDSPTPLESVSAEESNTSAEDPKEDKKKKLLAMKEIMDTAISDDKDEIIDVSIKSLKRTKVRINNDDSKIVDLNISDVNIGSRLTVGYKKLTDLMDKAFVQFDALPDNVDEYDEDKFDEVVDILYSIDKSMREQVDYIFDSPVSDIICNGASMWSPVDGMFVFEQVIETLAQLYQNNLSVEFKKMRARVNNQVTKHRAAVSKFHR